MTLRPETHDRKIRRAAADIGDQRDFLRADLALVFERGRDRLELESDLIEADAAGDDAQRLLRLAIGAGVVVDEVHGTAMDDVAQLAAHRLFGAAFHRAEVVGDHIAKADPLPAQTGGLVDQRGAEHRFEAPHQPAGGALDIGLHGPAADQDGAVHLIEDRAGNRASRHPPARPEPARGLRWCRASCSTFRNQGRRWTWELQEERPFTHYGAIDPPLSRRVVAAVGVLPAKSPPHGHPQINLFAVTP